MAAADGWTCSMGADRMLANQPPEIEHHLKSFKNF